MNLTVNDVTPVCANPRCAVPLRLSRSVAANGCCCCRGDHAPDTYWTRAAASLVLSPAAGLDARPLLAETEPTTQVAPRVGSVSPHRERAS